jgi:hypothetical protein
MSKEVSEIELIDFHDPGFLYTWLVEDAEAFFYKPGGASKRDRQLHFGLTYQEWLTLYFDVLGIDRSGFDKWAAEHPEEAAKGNYIDGFSEELPDYPLLSRIHSYLDDAIFEGDEIRQLRDECLRVKSNTSNVLALRGLDKLIHICDWARSLNLNIFLMCD